MNLLVLVLGKSLEIVAIFLICNINLEIQIYNVYMVQVTEVPEIHEVMR